MTVTGVTAIIYDDMGEPFFLLFRRSSNWKGWEFLKGKLNGNTEEQAIERVMKENAGIPQFKIKKKLEYTRKYNADGEDRELAIFLVESNMNIPVQNYKNSHKHDSYIWVKESDVHEKLEWDNEKQLFQRVLKDIKG